MYLCRELTDLSLPRIGQAFGGRDHTTVMHADRKIRQQMAERRSLYNQIAELTNRIKQTSMTRRSLTHSPDMTEFYPQAVDNAWGQPVRRPTAWTTMWITRPVIGRRRAVSRGSSTGRGDNPVDNRWTTRWTTRGYRRPTGLAVDDDGRLSTPVVHRLVHRGHGHADQAR